MKTTGAVSTTAAVRAALRDHDYDRYLAALFAPSSVRNALMALYAFNADVGRIPSAVSEPMLGEIRLQWWRDALANLAVGEVTGNPIADALGGAMREHGLPKALLLGVVDARVFDLSGDPMPDMQALKAFLQKTHGTLFSLATKIVTGRKPGEATQRLARDAGFVWGLTELLRKLPVDLAHGRLYLPVTHFHDAGADPEALLTGRAEVRECEALRRLRADSRETLESVRAAVNTGPREAALAFLPCALVPLYLAALEDQAAKPLEIVADISALKRLSRLTWSALRGGLY